MSVMTPAMEWVEIPAQRVLQVSIASLQGDFDHVGELPGERLIVRRRDQRVFRYAQIQTRDYAVRGVYWLSEV